MLKIFNKLVKIISKENKFLLVIFILLALFFRINRLEIFLGVVIDLSSVFLILILLTYGLKYALIATILLSSISIFILDCTYFQFLDVIHILVVGILPTKISKLKSNIIISDLIYWTLFMIPTVYSIIIIGGDQNLKDYYYLFVLFTSVVGIINTFIASNIYDHIIKKHYKIKTTFTYNQIILQIVTLAILMPFCISIFTTLNYSGKHISNTVKSSTDGIHQLIGDELELWSQRSIINLQLSNNVEVGLLQEAIAKGSRHKPYNIKLIDNKGRVLININNIDKGIEDNIDYKIKSVSEGIKYLMPINKEMAYFNEGWIKGFYVYNKKLEDLGLELSIEIPNSVYSDEIIIEYLSQFKFLFLATIIIGIITIIFNRVIFKSLDILSKITMNLPNKLKRNYKIKWPTSKIIEIDGLIKNVENMSDALVGKLVDLEKSQDRLYELAYYDALTGLPNRVFFRKHLDDLVNDNYLDKHVCVIFIDLDRFKYINDSWGHHIGDELLKQAANRFKTIVKDNCNVFRLGGDEFVVVTNIDDYSEVEDAGQLIMSVFDEEFNINGILITTKCSVGVSIYPDHGEDMDTIIKYADIAMYASKEKGGNNVQVFNQEINKKLLERLTIEEATKEAIVEDQFTLYYQPKFSGSDYNIKSLEALIRWENSPFGFLPPDRFIPIAEESDLILEIDKWVVFEACRRNKRLQDEGFEAIPISVNLSAKHFANRDILRIVEEALEAAGLEPHYLKIEITESVLIRNIGMVIDIINKLNEIGVQVSIDDFGKGYSSLNQLMNLPINEVKIDRDFIQDIDKDHKKKSVVKLVVELAHSFNLNVVAEGIETEGEKKYLSSIDCDELQGYLFSRPVNFEELKKKLNRSSI